MTAPTLLVPHALVLLELDSDTGRSELTEVSPDLAIAAAFLAELELHALVFAPGANQVARRANAAPTGFLAPALDALPDRPVSASTALGFLALRATHLRAATLRELEAWGAITLRIDRWFGLPIAWRWPTEDPTLESTLADRLRAHVVTAPRDLPGTREDCVLSLAEACGLLGSVWSAEEQVAAAPRVRERARLAPIGEVLGAVSRRPIS